VTCPPSLPFSLPPSLAGLSSYSLTIRGSTWPCDNDGIEAEKNGGGREGRGEGTEEEVWVEEVSVSAVSLLPVGEGRGGGGGGGGGGGAVGSAAVIDSRVRGGGGGEKGGGGMEEWEDEEEEGDSLIQSSSAAVAREGGKARVKAFYTVRTTWSRRQRQEGREEEEEEEEGGGRGGDVGVKEHRRRFKDFDKLDEKVKKEDQRERGKECRRRKNVLIALIIAMITSLCKTCLGADLSLFSPPPSFLLSFLLIFRSARTSGATTSPPPFPLFLPSFSRS